MNGRGKIIYSTGQIISGEWENNHNIKVTEEENSSKAEKLLEEIISKHAKSLKSGKEMEEKSEDGLMKFSKKEE